MGCRVAARWPGTRTPRRSVAPAVASALDPVGNLLALIAGATVLVAVGDLLHRI